MGTTLDPLAGQKLLLTSQTSSGLPIDLVDCQDLPISMLGEETVTLIDLSRFGLIDQVKIVRDKNIGFVHFLSISVATKVRFGNIHD